MLNEEEFYRRVSADRVFVGGDLRTGSAMPVLNVGNTNDEDVVFIALMVLAMMVLGNTRNFGDIRVEWWLLFSSDVWVTHCERGEGRAGELQLENKAVTLEPDVRRGRRNYMFSVLFCI